MSEPRRSVCDMEIFTAPAPSGDELWSDPELRAAYLEVLAREAEWTELPDEDEVFDDPRLPDCPEQALADRLIDLEATVRSARALTARQDQEFHLTLQHAAADPDPWVGPDPTLDPLWRDPRGRSVRDVRVHRSNLAVRSAAADIGARIALSDHQVRSRAHRAAVLSARMPRLWDACLRGDVSEQNGSIAVDLAASLPHDHPDAWQALDEALHDIATPLAPGRFRVRARVARERVHPRSLTDRHADAARGRRVDVDPALDDMAYIVALVPATDAYAIDNNLDQTAADLAASPDETRTRQQLRADALVDMLTRAPDGAPGKITAVVHLTIPALTLLGRSDDDATLDGYGPIPIDTAKELAGTATSWIRVLTHPVTGTVLDVDRRAYRVPADLRRWLGVTYLTCVFPGCTRPARECDMDHLRRWADGGTTSATNLDPGCPPHHPVKDETLWRLERDPATGALSWTSPTGYKIDVDPPPF